MVSWPTPSLPATAASPSLAAQSGTLDWEERRHLKRLILYGFLARAVVALVLEWTGYSIRFAPDEATYSADGWQMALYWSDVLLLTPWRFTTDQPLGYFYVNAASFYLFGHTEVPLKLLNSFIGALGCRYVYLTARELFGKTIARPAATLFEFFPSLILWSALNIRDVWVVLLILFISWKSLEIVRGGARLGLVSLIGALFVLTWFRDYLFFVVGLPPVLALLIGRRGHLGRNFVLTLIAGVGVLFLIQQGAVRKTTMDRMSLETMSQVRQEMASGGSAFHEEVDISTPANALTFLPLGVAYFLFSPFPWQITSLLKLFSVPEMLLLYALTPAIFRGIRYAVRTRFRESFQILLLTGLLTVSYALGEGNVGTLYRHRAQVIGFYLMFAAVGLELRRQQGARLAPADGN